MERKDSTPQTLVRGFLTKRNIRIVGIVLGLLFLFPQLSLIFSMGSAEEPSVTSGDVNDFEFESFDASYQLSLEESGRSVLDVRETLVALFPERDQNRGLFRYIPDWYEGSPLGTEVLSLTDETGSPRPLETYLEGDFVVVDTAVPEGSFLRGRQSFILDYSQSNVLREFGEDGIWEFYWDVNGTGWLQKFQSVSASIEIDGSLARDLLQDRLHCYFGEYGSDQKCDITIEESGAGYVVHATAEDLGPGETLTVALGFRTNSVVLDEQFEVAPWISTPSWILFLVLVFVILPSSIFFRVRRLRHGGLVRQSSPEYLPPKELDLHMAALLLKKPGALMTSKLLQLAVEKKVRLIEFEKGKWALKRQGSDLTAEDEEFLEAILGGEQFMPKVGELAKLPSKPSDLGSNYIEFTNSSSAKFKDLYLREIPTKSRLFRILPAVAVSLLLFGIGFLGIAVSQPADPTGFVLTFPAVILSAVIGLLVSKKPLNAAGAENLKKLSGLKVYMKLAEEERLAFLQSPEGAIRRGDDRYVVLHERLLPWAVLLGLAKNWAKELDVIAPAVGGSGIIESTSHGTFAESFGAFDSSVSGSMGSASGSGGSGGGGGAGGGGGGGGGGGQ
jgi:uncharacterized membrane protein YgcG